MEHQNNNKGFTLIELILVTIILGILSAVAVPRIMGTVNRAEEAVEDQVLATLLANAEAYAMEEFIDTGRKSYPVNPFNGANVDGYVGENAQDLQSGEWTYDSDGHIRHMRNDDSQWIWYYSSNDDRDDQADDRGSFGDRYNIERVNGDDSDL